VLSSVTGLILAGGKGSRMGGVDKGLQIFRGRRLVDHVYERLAPQVGGVIINANQNQDEYRSFGVRVVSDAIGGFAGPLADLTLTANTQPALLATSYALTRVLREELGIQPAWAAGHSLGEFSALVAAGALPFAAALRVVREDKRPALLNVICKKPTP